MDILSARNAYLKEIEGIMSRCSSKLESLVSSIGWDMESLTKHVKDSYDLDEESIELDYSTEEKQAEEGPRQGTVDYEKVYNDLISGLPNQSKNQEKSEAQTILDLLELERNMKRRRISYKNKVHTKNKSHTEVLRELVREQMEVLNDISGVDSNKEGAQENDGKDEGGSHGLIQLGYIRGNPHTAWQRIGHIVESRAECDEKAGPDNIKDKKERLTHESRNYGDRELRHSKGPYRRPFDSAVHTNHRGADTRKYDGESYGSHHSRGTASSKSSIRRYSTDRKEIEEDREYYKSQSNLERESRRKSSHKSHETIRKRRRSKSDLSS